MPRRKPDAADFARANGSTVGELLLPSPDPTHISEADVPTGSDVALQERHTLARILDNLVAYQDTLEMVSTDLERDDIKTMIGDLQSELITKVDRYAAVMRRLEAEAEWEKAESDRHGKRRKRYEAAYAFLERYAIDAMHAASTSKLEGRGATLKLRQGPGALVVTSECDVPMEYKAVTVTMPAFLWNEIREVVEQSKLKPPIDALSQVSVSVCKDKAKRAIKAGAEVPGADVTFEDGLVVE